jgi:acyl transferase domain-containing protein
VVGLSCRFPGANSADEYWQLLAEGREAIGPFPTDRPCSAAHREVSTKLQAGFLKCPIDEFDAKFFGISPREAPFVDPQQRLLLEVTWESLENAGINPQSLRDTDTGVFLGIWQQDYERLLPDAALSANDFFHRYLGNEFSATASRVSFCLGLHGPAIASESGCSSALGGLHLACESLLRGETSLAIASGVNLVLIPFNPFSGKGEEAVVLSKDFRCKTFDESADGFVRYLPTLPQRP